MKSAELEELLKAVSDQDSLALKRVQSKIHTVEQAIAVLEREITSIQPDYHEVETHLFFVDNFRHKHSKITEKRRILRSLEKDICDARHRLSISFGKLTAFRAARRKYKIS